MGSTLANLVIGDDYDVERSVEGVPDDDTLASGWLTIKEPSAESDSDAIIQKQISTLEVAGVGVIDDTGTDGTGNILFQLTNDDTALLSPIPYVYDIQVKTAAGKIYTVESGRILPVNQVTQATS